MTEKTKEYFRKYKSERYFFLKERGLCPRCGKEEVEPGKTLCSRCAKDQASYQADYRERKKEQGLCICGRPKSKEHKLCDSCLEKQRERARALRQSRIEQGLCPVCGGKKSDTTKMRCEKCREVQRQYDLRKKAA